MFEKSKLVEVIGRVHSDFFHQSRLLLNGVPLKIGFHRANPQFCLISKDANSSHKIIVKDAVLFLQKVQLTDHRFEQIQKSLERAPVLYPINHIDLRTRTITAAVSNLTWNNAYQGKMPNKVIIGFVENKSFAGDYQKTHLTLNIMMSEVLALTSMMILRF